MTTAGGSLELATAGAPFADCAKTLKQRAGSRWPIALRRLAPLRLDYPAKPLTAAIEAAAHYGLYGSRLLVGLFACHASHDLDCCCHQQPSAFSSTWQTAARASRQLDHR